MRRPKTLEEALKTAAAAQEEDAQVFGQMAARHRENEYDADGKRKSHGRSAEVQMGACAASASDPVFAACLKEMEDLKTSNAKMQEQNARMQEQLKEMNSQAGYKGKKPYNGPSSGKPKGPYVCYSCQEPGHFCRNCPKEGQSAAGTKP